MDKIIELLLGIREEITGLRSDITRLSEKVDHLENSHVHTEINNISIEEPLVQNTSGTGVNYGRVLSPSEQRYIDQLHQKDHVNDNINHIAETTVMDDQTATISPQFVDPQERSVIEKFFMWLAQDWPMKVGGFFVIAAVGWFVTYAARVGWLSETARVVLGYGFAAGCIAFGTLRAERVRLQGNLFLVIGIAAMFIATLAGIYFAIISDIVGLFVMLVSVGFVTFVSFKQKNISLTSSMIFFGAIIPIFFFASVGINTIFVYLFILTLGTLWIVSLTQWRGLTMLMLIVVGFYSIGYILNVYRSDIEQVSNVLVAFIFIATFYIANVMTIIRSKKTHAYDLTTAMGIGILFLIWMLNFAPQEVEVFLLLIGVLCFSCASYVIFSQTGNKMPTVVYGGVSGVLFAVATALQFDGPVLVTAYLVETSAVIIILLYFAHRVFVSRMQLFSVALYAVPLFMSFFYVLKIFAYFSIQRSSVMSLMPGLFVVCIVCVTAFSVASSILRLTDVDNGNTMTFFRIFAYIGGFYGLLFVWFVTHLFMGSYDIATFVALVIYTIIGVIFYIMGVRENYRSYMFVGGLLFALVVARVLFVEFWEMDIAMRSITSFVLGALLISTAFIRPTKK